MMKGFTLASFCLPLAFGVLPAAAQVKVVLPPAPPLQVPAELALQRQPFTGELDIELMGTAQPGAMIALRDGGLAFSAHNLGAIGRVDRERKKVTYFYLGKGAKPVGLTEAPDGQIYSVDRALNVIHRANIETGEVTRIAMPADAPRLDLVGIRADFQGKLWFSGAAGWLGSLDVATGQLDVSSHDDLQGLGISTIAESGTIWFVAGKSGRMIRIEANRSRFDSAALPEGFRGARGISVAANGDVWVSSFRRNVIGKHSGRGQWQVIPMPFPESQPQAILARKDGSVLVADGMRRVLYRYTPSLERFDEVGKLGEGGHIKALLEVEGGVAAIDMGADRIRVFLEDPARSN